VSEPLPPAEPAREPRKKGLKGALTHKLGPLPMWVWVVIVAAIILLWVVWKNKTGASQQQGPSSTAGAGQVPQFVNQTFTSPGPPPAADQDGDEDKDRQPPKPQQFPDPGLPPHPKPPGRRPPPDDDDTGTGRTGGPPFGRGGGSGPPGRGGEPRRRRRRRRRRPWGSGDLPPRREMAGR
jgi:hypothetical protein